MKKKRKDTFSEIECNGIYQDSQDTIKKEGCGVTQGPSIEGEKAGLKLPSKVIPHHFVSGALK